VFLTSDGGGQVPAARWPVHGAGRVARFVLGVTAMIGPGEQVQVINVDGLTAVVSLTVSSEPDHPSSSFAPGKLPRLGAPVAAWLCGSAMMSSAGCTTGWRGVHTPPYGGSG